MAHISLTLEGVSFTLADGRVLFQDLNQVFDQRRTGLVGRNGAGKSTLRTHPAQMGLEAQLAAAPVAGLSGGERLKVALACALYAHPPAQLLLLDEPSNHLDLVLLKHWRPCFSSTRARCWWCRTMKLSCMHWA